MLSSQALKDTRNAGREDTDLTQKHAGEGSQCSGKMLSPNFMQPRQCPAHLSPTDLTTASCHGNTET